MNPATYVEISAVKNGWIVRSIDPGMRFDPSACRQQADCLVFTSVHELCSELRELLKPTPAQEPLYAESAPQMEGTAPAGNDAPF